VACHSGKPHPLPCTPVGIPDVMGLAEVAERLGVSASRADQIVRQRDFPLGKRLKMGTAWSTEDVEEWIARRRPPKAEA
jgi:predicted DNA-binding transcriptional regulator AlpA